MNPVPPGWSQSPDGLRRSFRFASFADAMTFMQRLAFDCEKADHHPDWTNVYDRVDILLFTHSAKAVTEKDLALAAIMNTRFAAFGL